MAAVTTIAPYHRAIEAPTLLRQLEGWILWRYEENAKETKPRKVPYYADGGRRFGQQGSEQDRGKLTSFAAARDAAIRRGFDGVGLALLPEFGITALDFDHCVDADGNIPDEVMAIVSQTYAEYSPSGTGIRAFVRGNLGNHKSLASSDQYGVETFASTGFVTFTGNILPIVDIMGFEDHVAEADEAVHVLVRSRFGAALERKQSDPDDFMAGHEPKLGLTVEQMRDLLAALDPDMGREDWVKVGFALHHECEGDDTGFDLWNDWSMEGVKYVSDEDLRYQWESFDRRKGAGHRQITMASVIKMAKDAGAKPLTAEDLYAVAAQAQAAVAALPPTAGVHTPEGFTGRYPIYSIDNMTRRNPPDWFIKQLLPRAELIMLYGASGSGKTFIALDLAAAIARGIEWRNLRTKKARVLYIAAEGGGGVGKRFEAYCRHHGIDPADLDIGVIIGAPNFMQREDISELVAAIAAAGGADIIFADTYAQMTPGANENSGEDMGLAFANAKALIAATGATVFLVHHAGKDASKGARGWSGMRAAVDAELEVIKHEGGERELRISKMKDGDDGLNWFFKLEVVEVGLDSDGDTVTSCVAVEVEQPTIKTVDNSKDKQIQRYGANERHVLEIIASNYEDQPAVPLNMLIDDCVDALPEPDPGKRDIRKQTVQRAVQSLAKRKDAPIDVKDGRVIFYIN